MDHGRNKLMSLRCIHVYLLDFDQPQNSQSLVQSYFGKNVSVLFDDGMLYMGIVTGKNPKTQLWVTKFEYGAEDFTTDPQNEKDYKLLD